MKLFDMFKDDATGQHSLGRVMAAIAFIGVLGCTGWLVYKSSQLPDLSTGWLSFILGSYGLNKASSTIKEIKNVGNPVVGESPSNS